jgi:hypothetical protein
LLFSSTFFLNLVRSADHGESAGATVPRIMVNSASSAKAGAGQHQTPRIAARR